jgi:transcriptional regulator with XRE-family HTH domain
MSLAEAIKQTMNARRLHTAEVARRLGEGYDRATFYRLLNGATTEPRLGTLLGLCRVLEVSPTELLQLAGLWPYIERPVDVLDVRLRDAFAQLQSLPVEDKRRAVTVVTCIAESWRKTSSDELGEQPLPVAINGYAP